MVQTLVKKPFFFTSACVKKFTNHMLFSFCLVLFSSDFGFQLQGFTTMSSMIFPPSAVLSEQYFSDFKYFFFLNLCSCKNPVRNSVRRKHGLEIRFLLQRSLKESVYMMFMTSDYCQILTVIRLLKCM